MSQSIIRNHDSAGDPRTTAHEIARVAHAEPSSWIRFCRRLLSALWQRRPRFDVESMYARDPRDSPTPNPTRPTSLSGKLVADIWLLNSKL